MDCTGAGTTDLGADWRLVDGVATAWFDAPSLIEGAALAGRIAKLPTETVIDVRATGARVRLDSAEHAEAVSTAARDLGLAANPAVLQQLSVVFESADPPAVGRFWQRVLDYAPGQDGGLVDPLRRDPTAAARDLGAIPDPGLPRFAQLLLDAVDVGAVRAFWSAALGHTHDRRAGVTDIHDPRRLNPVLVFQQLDASETQRRRQRNRIHVELAVPSDIARERLATAVAAGGRLLDESADRWRIADPEGNEIVIAFG
ncbi:VOC family protein [Luedemannella helvata]|uniref:Glyoxalase-like domain-containing protein n=1 Tax=Luedemannella helvata TaxID=349315 RepID=A0ABP4WCR8_9ACTN